jgi:hypothetical protein
MALRVPANFCLHCSEPVARNTRQSREYCSDECYAERKKVLRKNPQKPTCAMCGCEFDRTSNRQKYCLACKEAKTRKYTADYNSINSEIILVERRLYMKEAREANPEKFRKQRREWWAANVEEIKLRRTTPEARAKANAYIRERYANDPSFAVHVRMNSAVHQAIREKKGGRKWEDVVGYTLDNLVRHLERQFLPDMSWENMGEWHIDHIVPKSSFNYTDDSDPEFKACWALTNLRPLWSGENQKKHAKRIYLI